jgi:hypothetical protein
MKTNTPKETPKLEAIVEAMLTIPPNKVFCLVGEKGTGKTTAQFKIAYYRVRRDKRTGEMLPVKSLFYTYSRDGLFENCASLDLKYIALDWQNVAVIDTKTVPEEYRKSRETETGYILEKMETFRNGNILIDDASGIFKFSTDWEFRNVLSNIRHNNNDIFFSFHSLNEIPVFMFTHIDYIILFKTNVKPDSRKLRNLGNFEKVLQAYDEVQTAKNPYFYGIVKLSSL